MAKEATPQPEADKPADERTAFERVQLARHANRPYTLDLIERLFEDFVELHGDKRFAEDPAVVAGFARFHGLPVAVVGHQKGRDTKQRSYRNFGMPKPEGYRKALRVMKLGEKFGRRLRQDVTQTGETRCVGHQDATAGTSRIAEARAASAWPRWGSVGP